MDKDSFSGSTVFISTHDFFFSTDDSKLKFLKLDVTT